MKKRRHENVLTWPHNAGIPFRRGNFSNGNVPATPLWGNAFGGHISAPVSRKLHFFKVALNS